MKIPIIFACLIFPVAVFAVQPIHNNQGLNEKAFFLPELYMPNSAVSYDQLKNTLTTRHSWEAFFAANPNAKVFFDPRSGHPVNIIASIPIISEKDSAKPENVAELFRNFIIQNQSAIGIDVQQLGPMKATQINDLLWHLTAPQVVNGVPVRYARYLGTINNGNLIIQGVENWSNVKISTTPKITSLQSLEFGFTYLNGRCLFARNISDRESSICRLSKLLCRSNASNSRERIATPASLH